MKKQFFEEVLQLVARELGEGYKVELNDVVKNNGLQLTSLTITKVNSAIGTNIYLDSFFLHYQEGRSIESITDRVLEIYTEECTDTINLDFLSDKNLFLSRVVFWVINREMNTKKCHLIPHEDLVGDLMKVYYLHLDYEDKGYASVLITFALMALRCDCGNKDIASHVMRHTFGAYLITKKVDLYIVSQLMGHASIRTTERVYTKLLQSLKDKEAINVFDDLNVE